MTDNFEALVAQYHRLVMSLLYRYYGGRLQQDAEDVAQEVWVKIWRQLKKNESNIVDPKSYIYRTVQSCAWDAVHRLNQRADVTAALPSDPSAEATEQVDSRDQRDRRLAMDQMIASLPADEARMVRAYLQGFNYAETARLLGCSEGRVRNLLTRIKKKLVIEGGN